MECLYISTAQPAGVPEILKKSLHSCSVKGEEEVFLIGKNFLKGTKVIFQENVSGKQAQYCLRNCCVFHFVIKIQLQLQSKKFFTILVSHCFYFNQMKTLGSRKLKSTWNYFIRYNLNFLQFDCLLSEKLSFAPKFSCINKFLLYMGLM